MSTADPTEVVARTVCRDCGRVFEVQRGEYDYFAQAGLHQPRRCRDCRRARREAADAAQEGGPRA
ncbi:MAG: zinc-ribbon domain containing protein [Vicinamibacterales bacterium]